MIRAALLGFGWWGQHVARRLADSPRFELVGVHAPELTGAHTPEGYRILPDFDAVLADAGIDAVVLTTPNSLHAAQVQAAAAAGKHVFCEKPLALSGAEAREMVAACEDRGVVLGVGHERRFEPAMQEVARLVREGRLGTVMHAEAAFSHDKLADLDPGNWRARRATAPAAGMTGMGIHLTDFFIWMFGPVASVQALSADRTLGWETGDTVSVQLGFRAGMSATLSAILCTPHFIRFHVFGSEQWVEVRNDTHPDTPGGQAHLTLSHTRQPLQSRSFDWTDAVIDNLNAFADAIDGRAPYPFTNHELAHNIEVLEAIRDAADTGETVRP